MSSSHIETFLLDQNLLAMNDPVAACDSYSNTVSVMINYETPTGTWEVEGGKNELCGYLKQSQATLVVLQASLKSHFENMTVISGFPWHTATANYDQITNVNLGKLGSIASSVHEEIVLKRTLTGLEIISIQSTGGYIK